MSKAQEVIELVVERYDNVLIDNDFEKAYGIAFKAFDEYTREELIEALFIEQALLLEMRGGN
jgi:hypothetical protein